MALKGPRRAVQILRSLLRFRLRSGIVVVLLVALWLNWFVSTSRLQQRVVRIIEQAGGRVFYEPQWNRPKMGVRRFAQPYLERCLGVDYSANIAAVFLTVESKEPPMGKICRLTGLEALCMAGGGLKDLHLREIANLKGLEILSLAECDVGDVGVRYLSRLTRLTDLELHGTRVTDRGLRHLAHLPRLETLNLEGDAISDDGIKYLLRMRTLRSLNLRRTRVSRQAIQALKDALPGLTILDGAGEGKREGKR